jgi:hypothetical protein
MFQSSAPQVWFGVRSLSLEPTADCGDKEDLTRVYSRRSIVVASGPGAKHVR